MRSTLEMKDIAEFWMQRFYPDRLYSRALEISACATAGPELPLVRMPRLLLGLLSLALPAAAGESCPVTAGPPPAPMTPADRVCSGNWRDIANGPWGSNHCEPAYWDFFLNSLRDAPIFAPNPDENMEVPRPPRDAAGNQDTKIYEFMAYFHSQLDGLPQRRDYWEDESYMRALSDALYGERFTHAQKIAALWGFAQDPPTLDPQLCVAACDHTEHDFGGGLVHNAHELGLLRHRARQSNVSQYTGILKETLVQGMVRTRYPQAVENMAILTDAHAKALAACRAFQASHARADAQVLEAEANRAVEAWVNLTRRPRMWIQVVEPIAAYYESDAAARWIDAAGRDARVWLENNKIKLKPEVQARWAEGDETLRMLRDVPEPQRHLRLEAAGLRRDSQRGRQGFLSRTFDGADAEGGDSQGSSRRSTTGVRGGRTNLSVLRGGEYSGGLADVQGPDGLDPNASRDDATPRSERLDLLGPGGGDPQEAVTNTAGGPLRLASEPYSDAELEDKTAAFESEDGAADAEDLALGAYRR